MSRPTRWWWSFWLVALIWLLANWMTNGHVRADLTDRATHALDGVVTQPEVTVSGRDVALSGVTVAEDKVTGVKDTVLRQWGVRKVAQRVTAPPAVAAVESAPKASEPESVAPAAVADHGPYDFAANLADDGLTLTGQVPDEDARKHALDLADRLFPGIKVTDRLTLAADAPAGFNATVGAGMRELSRLTHGALEIDRDSAKLSGEVRYKNAVESIKEEFKASLPDGFKPLFGLFNVREVAMDFDATACQTRVNELLENTTILFETDSADISRDSAGLLDRIAGTFVRCPDVHVEIAGHTDATGNIEGNQTLSEQRANSVRDYLVRAGIAGDDLTARGYGESKPAATNDTESGKARNRRIEFVVE